jgi:hypothetical protein
LGELAQSRGLSSGLINLEDYRKRQKSKDTCMNHCMNDSTVSKLSEKRILFFLCGSED